MGLLESIYSSVREGLYGGLFNLNLSVYEIMSILLILVLSEVSQKKKKGFLRSASTKQGNLVEHRHSSK